MGVQGHDVFAIPSRVILAREQPFRLGSLQVDPVVRQVRCGDRRETLEPRVMQVLIALARANGEAVTRDDLIEWCWSGRIVGDDAINRVLSRIRKVAAGIAVGSFAVETIPRVGYRLTTSTNEHGTGPAAGRLREAPLLTRRAAIAAGAAVLAGTTLFGIGRLAGERKRSAEATELLDRSVAIFLSGRREDYQQAVAYMTEATRLDPDDPELLGALALAYAAAASTVPASERPGYVTRAKAAARQALELDPGEVRANKTLIGYMPWYGNWAELDRISRRMIADHPDHPLAVGTRAELLMEMGRWREAEPLLLRKHKLLPFESFVGSDLIVARWGIGNLPAADAALAEALRLWPRERVNWETRISYLAHTGRAAEALRLIDDVTARPQAYPDAEIAPARAFIAAKRSGSAPDIARATKLNLALAEAEPAAILTAMQRLASIGQTGPAADLMRSAYTDPRAEERFTRPLFEPPMATMWSHPVFGEVTRAIGLESYWAETGMPPEFRRALRKA